MMMMGVLGLGNQPEPLTSVPLASLNVQYISRLLRGRRESLS